MSFNKVKMSPELMEQWGMRDIDGNLLAWDWGEPDDDGFYCPTISVDYDDNLVLTERARVAQLEADNAALKRKCEALLHAVAHSPVYWKVKDTYTELRDVVDALLTAEEPE